MRGVCRWVKKLLQQQQFHPESKPSQPESVTLISSQKETAPPSLPRLAVLAFAPLPALSLRAVGSSAPRLLSVRSVGSVSFWLLSLGLAWLAFGVFLLLLYKCKTIVFTFVNYNERSGIRTVL